MSSSKSCWCIQNTNRPLRTLPNGLIAVSLGAEKVAEEDDRMISCSAAISPQVI